LFRTLANIFRVAELRNKVLFTLALLCVYRIGFYVPLPGVNADALLKQVASSGDSALGTIANYLSVFSGGDLGQSTIFGLGIMPYISASIILQLLSTVMPQLEQLRKEGEPGMRKINEWTRYLTVGICVIQGVIWMRYLTSASGGNLLLPVVRNDYLPLFWIAGLTTLTAGSLFLMWLGEQIDQYGIGNGVSLIITAGIISRMPQAITWLITGSPFGDFGTNFHQYGFLKALQKSFDVQAQQDRPYTFLTILFVVASFIIVVAGSILLTQAQRRIKIQQAKHMRGRRVYGGTAAYLPLRVNHAGVMPIIFASSLMMLPSLGANALAQFTGSGVLWRDMLRAIILSFTPGKYLYEVLYVAMIFFFSYFWNTVQFNPKEMANQLRDYGSFVPGLRPGKRTADYLEAVMTRITYVGAIFLSLIAVIPTLVGQYILHGGSQAYQISQFLGGTGLLIVISVMLDLVNRIEANLVMRNYGGFLETGSAATRLKDRIRGPVGRSPVPPKNDGNTRGLPA
jgi:preprotein translocase subunit SecY